NLRSAADLESFERRVRELTRLGTDQGATFVEQLLHYSVEHRDEPSSRGLVGRILEAARLSKERIVRVLVRHLENVDPAVVFETREWLRGYEDHSVTRPSDFSVYRSLIEKAVRAGRDVPTALV